MMETKVISVRHLKKAFGNNYVLKDINLDIKKGENLVIFGRSGSGKSVLVKCMVGLIEPDEGSIEILGEDVLSLQNHDLDLLRKKIGFLFQSAALYDAMTVRENLELPLRDLKLNTRDEITLRVVEALQNVGLEEAIDKMPSELSGGMKKRVGLARTLILKPEIILYDEPTTGLDPITSREISHLIIEIQKKYKTSSIIITHDISCAHITANRIMVIKDGVFIAEGTYEELSSSKDKWVRSFFQDS